MSRQEKRDIEEESHFIITDALEVVYSELKEVFGSEDGSRF